jgi:hypothetical protein
MSLDFTSGDVWHCTVEVTTVVAAALSLVAIYVALSARAEATRQRPPRLGASCMRP